MRITRALVTLTSSLILFGALAAPAQAAPVGTPWVVASTPTSLTLDWATKKGVSKYRIYYSTSFSGVTSKKAKSKVVKGSAGTVSGLKANTMYCFQVAKKSGSSRSPRYCHSTMAHANKSTAAPIGVSTFNICSVASGCAAWTASRENLVVQRIAESASHIVTIQEGSRRIGVLEARLEPLGFALASSSGTEAVFYRTNSFEPETHTVIENVGDWETLTFDGDSSGWSTEDVFHWDENANYFWEWNPSTGAWERKVRAGVPVEQPLAGDFRLGGNATATWATLRYKPTGKTYTFVSAHVSSGKSAANDRARAAETRNLVTFALPVDTGRRGGFCGGLQSERRRATDAPRIEFARYGITDTYQRSSSYKNARYNSYNGWDKTPRIGTLYGDHVDGIFAPANFGASHWQSMAKFSGSNYATPHPSDHNLVRVNVWLD